MFEGIPFQTVKYIDNPQENVIQLSTDENYLIKDVPTMNVQFFTNCNFKLAGITRTTLQPASSFAEENLFYIQNASLLEAKSAYFTERSKLESYQLKYTYGGSGMLNYEGRTYILEPGIGYFIDCRKKHYYKTLQEPWRHLELHMTGSYINKLYEAFHTDGNVIFKPTSEIEFIHFVEEIFKVKSTIDPYREYRVSCMLNSLLLQLVTESISYKNEISRIPDQLQYLVHYLDNNYTKEMSLDGLAVFFNMSKGHLCRVFKKYIGMTVGDYVALLRINRAKYLLENTTLPANQIGKTVGYDEENYFYRVFRQKTGYSAKAWRNKKSSEEKQNE